MSANRIRTLENAQQVRDMLCDEAEGVLKSKPRKTHAALPPVVLNDEEHARLERTKRLLRLSMRRRGTQPVALASDPKRTSIRPTTRSEADHHLKGLMLACFEIGQQTQFGPAVVRVQHFSEEKTRLAREARTFNSEVIDQNLKKYESRRENSEPRSAGQIAMNIGSGVNAELEAASKPPMKVASIRKAIGRLRKHALSTA